MKKLFELSSTCVPRVADPYESVLLDVESLGHGPIFDPKGRKVVSGLSLFDFYEESLAARLLSYHINGVIAEVDRLHNIKRIIDARATILRGGATRGQAIYNITAKHTAI